MEKKSSRYNALQVAFATTLVIFILTLATGFSFAQGTVSGTFSGTITTNTPVKPADSLKVHRNTARSSAGVTNNYTITGQNVAVNINSNGAVASVRVGDSIPPPTPAVKDTAMVIYPITEPSFFEGSFWKNFGQVFFWLCLIGLAIWLISRFGNNQSSNQNNLLRDQHNAEVTARNAHYAEQSRQLNEILQSQVSKPVDKGWDLKKFDQSFKQKAYADNGAVAINYKDCSTNTNTFTVTGDLHIHMSEANKK